MQKSQTEHPTVSYSHSNQSPVLYFEILPHRFTLASVQSEALLSLQAAIKKGKPKHILQAHCVLRYSLFSISNASQGAMKQPAEEKQHRGAKIETIWASAFFQVGEESSCVWVDPRRSVDTINGKSSSRFKNRSGKKHAKFENWIWQRFDITFNFNVTSRGCPPHMQIGMFKRGAMKKNERCKSVRGRESQTAERHQTLHHFLNLLPVHLEKIKKEVAKSKMWTERREKRTPNQFIRSSVAKLLQSCWSQVWNYTAGTFFFVPCGITAVFLVFIVAFVSKSKVFMMRKLN